MVIASRTEMNRLAKKKEKELEKFILGAGFRPPGKTARKYQGITVGGKRYHTFAEIPTIPAHKKSTKQKLAGGIKLAIL